MTARPYSWQTFGNTPVVPLGCAPSDLPTRARHVEGHGKAKATAWKIWGRLMPTFQILIAEPPL